MTLCRKTSKYYMDEYDVNGLFNVLSRRIDLEINNNEENGEAYPYYMGAALLLNILRNREETRDQSVFMGIFENQLREEGILLAVDRLGD